MIIDLNIQNNKDIPNFLYDVCIIGAGAAGITVANELGASGLKIALIEAGSTEFTEESQDLYQGKITGDPYLPLDVTRLRYLGGSTNHWGGMCRTFEEVDFDRGYLGDEYKWPIEFNEIYKYLEKACKILEIDNNFEYPDLNLENVKPIKFQTSMVRFKEKYQSQLSNSPNITLFINSNLQDINGDNEEIKTIKVQSYTNNSSTIKAKKFVLAMGGIENSRYLLWFKKKYGGKYFDPTTPIGEYWMEHPTFSLGRAFVKNSVYVKQFYSLKKKPQKMNKILGCSFRMHGASSSETKQMLKNLICVAPNLGKKIAELLDKRLLCGILFRASWEQSPAKTSTVTLLSEVDRFGISKANLTWSKNALDRKTIKQSINIFNEWFLRDDIGRIKLDDWLLNDLDYPENDELGGQHHMGGTRMSDNRKFGVVDRNCKVFGSKNFYVAGSSIYVTGGYQNPTLGIVQFSLRLSDHLKSILL
jgi:choline dehydrogenase-like flavoprotein